MDPAAISAVTVQLTGGHHVVSTDGTSIALSSLVLDRDGTTTIDGSGFLAGSTVYAWLFSEPTLLAQVVTGADGSFRIEALIPATIPAGSHTFVLSPCAPTGTRRLSVSASP